MQKRTDGRILEVHFGSGRMKQIIRELKRQVAGEKLAPEQLKGLIRAGYVYRNGDEHLLTDMGRNALAQPGVYPGADAPPAPGSNARASFFHLEAGEAGEGKPEVLR
jgi:hypothetical protein